MSLATGTAVDVAVVGGGVVGLSVAYHAARRGATVALLEAEEVGSGASGALAGMLSGQGEAEGPGPLRELLLLGRDHHRTFGPKLYEDTGLDPGYAWNGALRTATDEASSAKLAGEHSRHEERGLPSRLLDGDGARELEPALSREVVAGLHLPEDGNVNPPQLVRVMAEGATKHGAKIREFDRATGFLTRGRRVTGLRAFGGDVTAGAVVLAGGAASGLLSETLGIGLPVHPVKGVLLETQISPVPMRANVWNHGTFYLVPKRDGRVIVGATEEPMVRDRRPTLGGVAELSQAALALVPALSDALFSRSWGGLRPTTPTGAPMLGPVSGWEGLLLATGHHRNGVLLSGITGETLAALALGEAPPVDVSPFLHEKLADCAPA
ncbi:MAG: glycine oxidase ThiO [Actinomycetota bacterium]|nr:glycine oxidase ThiO [Actinomycetota bacterium]PLS84060.1 MAG: glycine oxidase ThiO [Actinomycetota bacterium]